MGYDTVVNIPGYKIYRRDRNWSGCDLRNKRGIPIYTRNNLSVIDVYRSNLYEFICLTVSLPSGNCILLFGLYHPLKTTYQECDLMDYPVNFSDTVKWIFQHEGIHFCIIVLQIGQISSEKLILLRC